MNEAMRTMLAISFALWSLVVVPSLCQAGVLTACCEDAAGGVMDPSVAGECCGGGACGRVSGNCDAQTPSHNDHPCDTCLVACCAAARPLESTLSNLHLTALCGALVASPHNLASASPASGFRAADPPDTCGLPFPLSDRPLRV